ncbi:hypothetical protein [Streptomyces spiramyceticus]|nr:hypothetical protein [Streptomyces spiramyceticus]
MREIAVQLMQIKRPDGEDIATYGPEFLGHVTGQSSSSSDSPPHSP